MPEEKTWDSPIYVKYLYRAHVRLVQLVCILRHGELGSHEYCRKANGSTRNVHIPNILKTSYHNRVSNIKCVMENAKRGRTASDYRQRKLEYYGHVSRHTEKYSIFRLILRGKIAREDS